GIAFQLIEAMGVIERAKIASEMKDLDQPSRASLRKYGVRFGAYHIYIPPLLKPAARALASLLWALKAADVDMSALSGAQHLAGSGRTSFPIDKQLARDAYRVLGYRPCGERAVRVDILERLADLIRPALAWRETSPGQKPAGAFDGRGFVVTQAMTSLTGSAGEDFASILRALGYRMERRPPLPPRPVAVEPVVAEIASGEGVAEASAETAVTAEASLDAQAEEAARASSAALLPVVAFAPEPAIGEASAEPATVSVEAVAESENIEMAVGEAAPSESSGEQAATDIAVAATAGGETVPAETDVSVATTPAEPELVEVWRPGGRSDERRPPRHDRARHRRQDRSTEGTQPLAAGEATKGELGEAAKREPPRQGRRDRHHAFRKAHPDQPAEGAAVAASDAAPARESREDKTGRPREGKGRGEERNKGKFRGRDEGRDGGRDKGRDRSSGRDRDRGGRENGPALRPYASSASPRERDRPADPNSPFAKLAALKEQLSAGRKD
ncbi:MAG TPA: helicase, partial [Bradyrhizobium sp.]|nr:helicase [Bradyrhizobium sp.]